MTRRELAQYLGVGEDAVRKAEDRGAITAGPDGLFEADQAARDFAMNRRGAGYGGRPRRDRSQGGGAGETLIEVQTRHEKVKLAERRVKLARMKGSLVDKKAVEKETFELIRAEREEWLNWPTEVAPEVAADLGKDVAEVEVLLERVVRAKLAGMSADLLRAGEQAA